MSGQMIIKWSEKTINDYLNKILETEDEDYVIVDTDSVYITMDKLVQKVLIETTEKVIDFLSKQKVDRRYC